MFEFSLSLKICDANVCNLYSNPIQKCRFIDLIQVKLLLNKGTKNHKCIKMRIRFVSSKKPGTILAPKKKPPTK